MTDRLLTNGYIVTVDDARTVLPDGWLLVRDGRIAGLGPMSAPPADAELTGVERLDLHGMLVIPGLINAHNHHWGNLFKNTGEGMDIVQWLGKVAFPISARLSAEDLRVAAYACLFEQLLTGTTCALNHATNVNDAAKFAAIVEPVLDMGARQFVAKEMRQPRVPALVPDRPARPHPRTLAEEVALAEELVDRYQGANDRVHMGLAIETGSGWMLASTTSDEIILATEDLAQRKNLRITDHLTGGSPQFIALTGGTEIEYLDRLGALSDRYVFIHGSGLLDPDIARLAEVGASLITNPFGNAYLGGVVAPVRSLVRAGVNVGLGSDGAYVNCSVDMVEQMKGLAMIQNAHNIDATFITAERAIEMATRNNAFAMGLEHEIGTLEVGKQADIAIFDLSKPRIGIPNRPIGALVFSTHGSDVHTVLVGGDILVSEGRLVFDGVEEILAEGRERATAMTQAVGLANTGPDWHR